MFISNSHKFKKYKIKITTELSFIRLFLAIGISGIETVLVLYMNTFNLTDSFIGFISAGFVIISLIAAFLSTPILEKLNEYKILLITILISIITFLIIGLTHNIYLFLFVIGISTISSVFRLNSFDILFRDKSKIKELNENESLMYSIMNIGWLVGPLIAGYVLVIYGISKVFLSSSLFLLISFFILFKLNIKLPKKKRNSIDNNFIKNLKQYISKKNLKIAYLISSGILIWNALIYTYIPLFVIKSGLNKGILGFFFAARILPQILIEFEIGKLANKFGFKIFFFLGFISLAIIAFFAFNLTNMNHILILLIIGSIPMALIEPIQDSFFFKQINMNDEEKFFPIYGTATQVGSFIGKFSIATILLFMPENFAYLIISFFMLIIGLISLKIK